MDEIEGFGILRQIQLWAGLDGRVGESAQALEIGSLLLASSLQPTCSRRRRTGQGLTRDDTQQGHSAQRERERGNDVGDNTKEKFTERINDRKR